MAVVGSRTGSVGTTVPESIANRDELHAAFDLFSRLSTQLSSSYQALEDRIAELSDERDRADRQRLRELEEKERISQRLQSLLDLLPGGVVVLDSRGRICDSNPAADALLGEALEGQRWSEVIARCLAPRRDDGHEVSLRNGRRLSMSTRSMEGGDGQLILLTDQTETRRLQENLARQERLTLMGRMVAALAHQIRTPLAAAMLYAGHLCAENLSSSQVARFASKIQQRLNAMEQQVRDMLIFVKGGVQMTSRICVGELVDALEAALEAPLASSACGLDWDIVVKPEAQLQCNRDALVGAVMNLVNNSIQAGGQGSGLSLRLAPGGDQQLLISVVDDGPGMDRDTLDRVQEAFYSTKPHGTGLGLAVARAVAHAHQGTLSLRSEPETGTVATISLPLMPASMEASHG